MASRKSPSAPEWQVILEEIRSQNRMTIEAVEAHRVSSEERFQSLELTLGGRIENIEKAMTVVIGRMDGLAGRMDRLAERMDRLGRRPRGEEL